MQKQVQILGVEGLGVRYGQKTVIQGVDFEIFEGETVVLLGSNGTGKSTIVRALAAGRKELLEKQQIEVEGKIRFKGKLVGEGTTRDELARAGLFVSEQNSPEIPGVTTTEVIKAALRARERDGVALQKEESGMAQEVGKKEGLAQKAREKCEEYVLTDKVREKISTEAKKIGLNIWFSERELGVGFSGGEKKKNEILQMLVLKPALAILDEIDSGLDVDACDTVSKTLADFQKATGVSFLIITHNMRILRHLRVDKTLVLGQGGVIARGDGKLALKVAREGFKGILKEGLK